MKKVLVVTGTRTQNRFGACEMVLSKLRPDLVLVGDASGIDAEARTWCKGNYCPLVVFCATTGWPAAGPKRNNLMAFTAGLFLKQGYEVSFAAFPHGEAKGTSHCVSALEKAGVTGVIHSELHSPIPEYPDVHTATAVRVDNPQPECEWRDDTEDADTGIIYDRTGPRCPNVATHRRCGPIVDLPVCEEHKCRCNLPLGKWPVTPGAMVRPGPTPKAR